MSATSTSDLLSRVSPRAGAWLVIGAVHVALVYVVTTWTPVRAAFDATPIEASILEAPTPPSDAPPPPMPQLEQPMLPVVEQPLVTINEEPPPSAITVAVAEQPPAPAPTQAAPRVVTDVAYIEPPQPKYPPESRRSGEEGLVVLRVLINEIGGVARVDVERSSGHSRLDDAACQAVRRARFRPYLENGVPRMALATIPIEFNWKSRRADKSGSRG
jgi:periplasmic protein TonB